MEEKKEMQRKARLRSFVYFYQKPTLRPQTTAGHTPSDRAIQDTTLSTESSQENKKKA